MKDIIIEIIKGLFGLAVLWVTLRIKFKQTELHKQINGRMDQLMEAKKAEGKLEEKEKNETKT